MRGIVASETAFRRLFAAGVHRGGPSCRPPRRTPIMNTDLIDRSFQAFDAAAHVDASADSSRARHARETVLAPTQGPKVPNKAIRRLAIAGGRAAAMAGAAIVLPGLSGTLWRMPDGRPPRLRCTAPRRRPPSKNVLAPLQTRTRQWGCPTVTLMSSSPSSGDPGSLRPTTGPPVSVAAACPDRPACGQ